MHICFLVGINSIKMVCICVLRGDAYLFYGGYKFNENTCAQWLKNTCAQSIGLGIRFTRLCCWFKFLKYAF